MDDWVFVLGEERSHVPTIRQTVLRVETRGLEHSPTKLVNLLVVCSYNRSVRKEVQLYQVAVHLPVVIHEHSFKSSSIHDIHYFKNTNRIRHLARTLTGDDLDHREGNDLKVSDKTALGDVLQVALDHPVETR